MLEMTQINYIKFLWEKEDLNITEIANRLDIAWRTAKKYAEGNFDTENEIKQKRIKPVMGPYLYLIRAWLEEDLRMPKKQRRTAKKIYDQLKKLTDFEGSYRSVRLYVGKLKREIIDAQKKQYVKLLHNPGVAQVDFGEFAAISPARGEIVDYQFLVMSFPSSNGQLCRVLPAKNAECLLEALKNMFEEINGAPTVIWFDNMTTAVKDILQDRKRSLTRSFQEFKWHYRFEANFCNPGKGNEKGHVENKVGYIRRNWMSPMPVISDLDEFNDYLKKEMIKDRNRQHSSKNCLISELWQEDMESLLKLPQEPREIFRIETARANKYGEIKLEEEIYHVPQAHYRQNLILKVYWDEIVVFDEYGEEKLTVLPRKYVLTRDKIDWQGELKIFLNKPRAIEHAAYLQALPETVKEYLLAEDISLRKKRVKVLLKLLDEHPITTIARALKEAFNRGNLDHQSLKLILGYQGAGKPAEDEREPLKESWTPAKVQEWQPGLKDYNELCREVFRQ